MWIELLFGASWLIDTWVIKDLKEKLLFQSAIWSITYIGEFPKKNPVHQVGLLKTGFGPYIIYKRYGPSETLLDLPGSSNTHFFLPNSI